MRKFYELEIEGKLVATRNNYAVLKEKGELSGRPYEIFMYRRSNFNKIGRFISKKDVDEIADMRRKGMKWDDISKIMGWTKGAMNYRMRQVLGHDIFKTPRLTNEKKLEILKLNQDGISNTKIAKQYGISRRTVSRILSDEQFIAYAIQIVNATTLQK